MTEKITDVAVAIFLKPDGRFLLSSRPEGKPYPGYWEFPGGKIEPGETVQAALVRELIEELNATITASHPWFTFLMRYTHATVRLHCWRVLAWRGEMQGMEGQSFAWQSIDAIDVAPTLPGCVPKEHWGFELNMDPVTGHPLPLPDVIIFPPERATHNLKCRAISPRSRSDPSQ